MNNCIDKDKAVFDPGIGQLVQDFNTFVNDVYSQLMSFNSIAQKRSRFKMFNSKIYAGMENNIAFYQGCLLWAYYLKNRLKTKNAEITGNVYLNLSKEQIENYDYMLQVNFLENYFDSYERDTLYYAGRKTAIPEKWKKILELYKEFLKLNKGFINTKNTSDLVLPDKLSKKTINADIKSIIDSAVRNKDLTELLRIDD